jgi:hypothetical protein
MFIAASLGQPLKSRDTPIPCTCLTLRERDKSTFPHIAYHGTNIISIQPILLDGLVAPGTVASCGKRINPPKNHIARDVTAFGLSDFAAGIFLSPSVYYSSDPTYAISFSHGDQQLIPVLECSVKKKSYKIFPSTVKAYVKHPGDDMNAIEWRVEDPTNVVINAVLFITKIKSIDAARKERIAKTS